MTKATSAFLVAMVALVAYGLFATLYWPVTAVSVDVWGDEYAQLPSENVTATLIGAAIWLVLAVVLTALSIRKRRPPHLVSFGLTAIALAIPTSLASVAVYNVIPTSTPYPDMLTPAVLLIGVIAIGVGLVRLWISSRHEEQHNHLADLDEAR